MTVPGAVAGWSLLHGKFGKRTFADVLAPAIEYAERGFAVSPTVQDKWVRATPLLRDAARFCRTLFAERAAARGRRAFRAAGAAHTLKLIADTRGEAFYRGEIADAIERFAQTTGGAITASDLSGYWDFVQSHGWVGTISTPFHGHDVHQIPPNGQGIAALSCLGMLRHTQLAEYEVDSADWHHVMIEAMKLAFADTYAYVGDPRSMTVTPAEMLNDDYLARRAKRIDMRRAADTNSRQAAARRHDLSECGRCERHDGVVHTIELHGLRFGRRGAGVRHFVAEPRRWFFARPGSPNCVAPGQATISYDHPRVSDERRRTANELWRDGWQHTAPGPRADAGANADHRAATAGGVRCAALESDERIGYRNRKAMPSRVSNELARAGIESRARKTLTWTSAPASSSGDWAILRSTVTSQPVIRGAMALPRVFKTATHSYT